MDSRHLPCLFFLWISPPGHLPGFPLQSQFSTAVGSGAPSVWWHHLLPKGMDKDLFSQEVIELRSLLGIREALTGFIPDLNPIPAAGGFELCIHSPWSRTGKSNSNPPGKPRHGMRVEPPGCSTAALHPERESSELEQQENPQGCERGIQTGIGVPRSSNLTFPIRVTQPQHSQSMSPTSVFPVHVFQPEHSQSRLPVPNIPNPCHPT